MFLTIVWLMIIVSVFMVIIVLVQRSKGGGLNELRKPAANHGRPQVY